MFISLTRKTQTNILPKIKPISKLYSKLRMTNSYIGLIIFAIIIHLATDALASHWDPYDVLGVQRGASFDQIKKAYRELAKKHHPDKSNLNENESNKKFIELNKAFDILKDPDKRSRFDHSGSFEDVNRHHNYQNRQTREYWTTTSGNGHRTFRFYSSSLPESYLKKTISARQYYEFLKLSRARPYLLLFYSDFCPTCNAIEPRWRKITDRLSEFIESYTININQMSNDLGINTIPHIACLIDGEMHSYQGSDLSLASIVKFVKSLIPDKLINLLISDEEQDKFIALPYKNKLSAIIIHNESSLKLRYLLLAHELKSYYRFGHISTSQLCQYKTIASNYNLTKSDGKSVHTSLLVFDETYAKKPVLSLNLDQTELFDNTRRRLYRWPFLILPRLSSQEIFDDLCLYTIPKNGFKTFKRLCVILLTSSQPMRNKLIEFIEMNGFVHDPKVVFAYLDTQKQQAFIDRLLMETTHPSKTGQQIKIDFSIILIERHQQNSRKAVHKWLRYDWIPEQLDKAKIELHDYITEYKRNPNIIDTKVALDILVDEDGPSLIDKIFWRFLYQISRSTYYILSLESFSTISILILCAVITSLLLYQLPSSAGPDDLRSSVLNDDEREYHKPPSYPQQPQQSHQSIPSNRGEQLKVIELKAETYNGLVRLSKPGNRTIVLLCDNPVSDSKLLNEFRKAVWPYRFNNTLLFAYLCLDKNLAWYKSLLEQILDVEDLNLNKNNCTGTVLVLNGYANKFNIYHAKHKIDYYDNQKQDDDFLSFNHDDDELEEHDIEGRLGNTISCDVMDSCDKLTRLPIWLDRVFDGSTRRYCMSSWPEEIK